MRQLSVGDVFFHERTFELEDVRAFTRVSGDSGMHHEVVGADGKLLVHGLLTATIPTKIGGDLDYLAREMQFEFLRPVYTGDTIRCEMKITELEARRDRMRLALAGSCTNQRGEEVLRIATRGVIRTSP